MKSEARNEKETTQQQAKHAKLSSDLLQAWKIDLDSSGFSKQRNFWIWGSPTRTETQRERKAWYHHAFDSFSSAIMKLTNNSMRSLLHTSSNCLRGRQPLTISEEVELLLQGVRCVVSTEHLGCQAFHQLLKMFVQQSGLQAHTTTHQLVSTLKRGGMGTASVCVLWQKFCVTYRPATVNNVHGGTWDSGTAGLCALWQKFCVTYRPATVNDVHSGTWDSGTAGLRVLWQKFCATYWPATVNNVHSGTWNMGTAGLCTLWHKFCVTYRPATINNVQNGTKDTDTAGLCVPQYSFYVTYEPVIVSNFHSGT